MRLLIVALSLFLWRAARAQETDAVCESSFGWMNNSAGLSPCAVGSTLLALCQPAHHWSVPKLSAGNTYAGPSVQMANQCQCSTVTFSLLSACAICQGMTTLNFENWSTNCNSSVLSVTYFPVAGANISIPQWAFQNTTPDGHFDLDAAERSLGINPDPSFPVVDIVLITLGGVGFVLLLLLGVCCYRRRHRMVESWRNHQQRSSSLPLAGEVPKAAKRALTYLTSGTKRVRQRSSGYDLDLEPMPVEDPLFSPLRTDPFRRTDPYDDLPSPPPYHQEHRSSSSLGLYNVYPPGHRLQGSASSAPPATAAREHHAQGSTSSTSAGVTSGHRAQGSQSSISLFNPGHTRSQSSLSLSHLPGHKANDSTSSLRSASGAQGAYVLGPKAPAFQRPKGVVMKKRKDNFGIDMDDAEEVPVMPAPTPRGPSPLSPPLPPPPPVGVPPRLAPPHHPQRAPDANGDVLLISHHSGFDFEIESSTDAATAAHGPQSPTVEHTHADDWDPRSLVPRAVRAAGYDPYADRGWPGTASP